MNGCFPMPLQFFRFFSRELSQDIVLNTKKRNINHFLLLLLLLLLMLFFFNVLALFR